MGRAPRITEEGVVYHLLNRRVMRLRIFEKEEDYAAFERVLAESLDRPDAPALLAYCLMPNHWHLVAEARSGTNLSSWMQWVAVTHTHRWHAHHHSVGEGPLYQGRFKSFPVQGDVHFLIVCRYVEANPLRAQLAGRAEEWRWSSLWARRNSRSVLCRRLAPWPVERPWNWLAEVNRPMSEPALKMLRQAVARGMPVGGPRWREGITQKLGLQTTLRARGRPRKPQKSS